VITAWPTSAGALTTSARRADVAAVLIKMVVEVLFITAYLATRRAGSGEKKIHPRTGGSSGRRSDNIPGLDAQA
jgi:hypothetical protein